MPYAAKSCLRSFVLTLRTLLLYPGTQIFSTVAPANTEPGVHSRSGNGPATVQPAFLLRGGSGPCSLASRAETRDKLELCSNTPTTAASRCSTAATVRCTGRAEERRVGKEGRSR